MKKFEIATGLALIAILASVVLFYSCSKQEGILQSVDETNAEKDFTIYNMISSFTEKMDYYKQNPMYKIGESIEVDSALWLMEGAMNLTYGFPFEKYGEFTTGEANITLQKNQEGEINMDEVAVKYQQLIDEAREDYYNSGYEDKGLYIVNLEKADENNDQVIFNVETVTGNKGADPWPFEQGQNWWYGEDEGGCEGNNAGSSDAAHQLAGIYPAYDITECMAIAGPKSVGVKGGEQWLRRPNDPMDNNYDYYIFCVKDNEEPFVYNTNLCLLYNKMNIYYAYLDDVITDLARVEFSIPEQYVFIDFDHDETKGYFEIIQPGNNTKYYHFFELLYGLPFDKPNCDPPIEL